MSSKAPNPLIAIACGGTGGHLFPGLAVAEELLQRDCDVMLLISPKEVDQQAVRTVHGMQIETLPAVGLRGKNIFKFAQGFWKSYQTAKGLFANRAPQIVLAMGGFTSAPPILAGRKLGAKTFLHESNSIPGRANRWLSRFVDSGFTYFPEAHQRMRLAKNEVTGMPVRPQFLQPVDPVSARVALGLNPNRPVLLIMGGSQGASGINNLVMSLLPALMQAIPELQFLHFSGALEFEKVQQAYKAVNAKSVVRPFFTEMELALGAATVAVSRSGASSLAEIAALRVPSVLIPYPTAADNHQFYNAKAFADCGAARLVLSTTTPEIFLQEVLQLLNIDDARTAMQAALAQWHYADAARTVADKMLLAIGYSSPVRPVLEDASPMELKPRQPQLPAKNFFSKPAPTPLRVEPKEANV